MFVNFSVKTIFSSCKSHSLTICLEIIRSVCHHSLDLEKVHPVTSAHHKERNMKRTDLEKQLGHKINNRISNAAGKTIFNKGNGAVDRKEQREKDRAAGLIPFAVKLNEGLVAKLNALAEERKTGINELVAELLEKGMEK